jgi:hypothetical protein
MSTPTRNQRPITILDYVKTRVGEQETYSVADHHRHGVDILGGCEYCHATIGSHNAYPSKTGFWRCGDCIGIKGYLTIEAFVQDVFGDRS